MHVQNTVFFPFGELEGPGGACSGCEIKKHLLCVFLQLFEDH